MRPRLAPGFTTLIDGDSLWLVAGEDVRYRLRLDDPRWLADMLAQCDGTRTVDELVTHPDARGTIERLFEERVLVEGTAVQAHVASAAGWRAIGTGPLVALLGGDGSTTVFVQDALDYRALRAINRELLGKKWMWITSAPGGRAYVGPLFVPDAGPCAQCLLVHFKRLSPAPTLYDALLAHDGPIAATPVPAAALDTLAALARWKLSLVDGAPNPALYALHVIDTATLTVSSHVPLGDIECEVCR